MMDGDRFDSQGLGDAEGEVVGRAEEREEECEGQG